MTTHNQKLEESQYYTVAVNGNCRQLLLCCHTQQRYKRCRYSRQFQANRVLFTNAFSIKEI
jgi:hypothetical protein